MQTEEGYINRFFFFFVNLLPQIQYQNKIRGSDTLDHRLVNASDDDQISV